MISSLILAAAIAQPCGIPVTIRHHKHHTPTPLQSCITSPVPMCFRAPEQPTPDEIALPPLPYYSTAQVADSGAQSDGIWIESGYGYEVGNTIYPSPAGASAVVALPPPSTWVPPSPPVIHGTPELDPGLGGVAITILLMGFVVIEEARRG